MVHSLIQFEDDARGVAAITAGGGMARRIKGVATLANLARLACDSDVGIADVARSRLGEPLNLRMVRLLAPVDLPDPARLHVTDAAPPSAAHRPDWRYRGDGSTLVAARDPLAVPGFALVGSERPEIGAVYYVRHDRTPVRVGFVLGNRFCDRSAARTLPHWPAQIGQRDTALAPELVLGALPRAVAVTSRLLRDGVVERERTFIAGEATMAETIATLEARRFEDGVVGRPGDLHVHFFGAGAPAAEEFQALPGDAFEVLASAFGYPMRNAITLATRTRARAMTRIG